MASKNDIKPPVQESTGKGWKAFTRQFARDIRLWLWVMALLFISRLTLILGNHAGFSDELSVADYAEVFFTGFRFDAPVATIIVFFSIVASSLCCLFPWEKPANIIRAALFYFATILWVTITAVTLGYFKQYHNQFDAHLLGVVHDDFGAIVKTIWQTYPIVTGLIVMILITALLLFTGKKWLAYRFPLRAPAAPGNILQRVAVAFLLLCLITLGLRGSWGRRPMQMKDAAQTEDFMINRCVINPITALVYAVKAYRELLDSNGLDNYLKKESIRAAFHEYAGRNNLTSVDDAFRRTAKGRPGQKPRHIYLILMESYDGWTMLDQHADWNISNELKKLGEQGIYVRRFLPGSRSTMTSLAAIITGLADAGVATNERIRPGEPPYATAIAVQMQKLGYDTHLYYAGYGGWQRIEDFAREQGFQYTHMGSKMDAGNETNEWGVTDKRLFAYMAEHFEDDKPTFNLVLTSSNHPPYTVNLEKENCPINVIPPSYQDDFNKGKATLEMLGHHWYSDKYLGKFVRKISSQYDGCLFAITADHWGRIFPGPRPSFFEKAIVPLVLYGPGILPQKIDPSQLSGSHYDLAKTLIELAADAGHEYHAMGRNMLTSGTNDIALSKLWYLGDDFILPVGETSKPQSLSGEVTAAPAERLAAAQRQYNLMHGISWWRICKGNVLPKE